MSESSAPEIVRLPPQWHYRLIGGMAILGLVAFMGFAAVIAKTGFVLNRVDSFRQQMFDLTGRLGLTLDDVLVEGRERTSQKEIAGRLNLRRGDNILQIDLREIKDAVEKLPWVRHAVIRRSLFPNVIHITLFERRVRAIWQLADKFYPIDTEGGVINAKFTSHEPILLIVGPGAPENIPKLLDLIKGDKEISDRIKVANFISERRWNLILDDISGGTTVKMPEEDLEGAWKKLVKLDQTKGLLKRKLTIIDLRFKDKVILKLEKGRPEETRESSI
jgi:cell division protein FtsQ